MGKSEIAVERPRAPSDARASRVAPAVAIIVTTTLLAAMPDRYRITPTWIPYAFTIAVLGPMAMVYMAPNKTLWRTVERIAITTCIALATLGNMATLGYLLHEIAFGPPEELKGAPLLGAAIAIWISNIVVFALLYWLVDRGGPDARAKNAVEYGDFRFPEQSDPDAVPPTWQPAFVDYLFLAYTGASGFGLTHTVPVSRLGKLLIMIEAQISLVTIVVVGARAVGILQ